MNGTATVRERPDRDPAIPAMGECRTRRSANCENRCHRIRLPIVRLPGQCPQRSERDADECGRKRLPAAATYPRKSGRKGTIMKKGQTQICLGRQSLIKDAL